RVEVNGKHGKQDVKVQMYADGKLMAAALNGKFEGEPKPVEGGMTEAISQVTARGGVFVGLGSHPEPEDKAKFDIDKFLTVSDFKLGKKETVNGREIQAVTYSLKQRNKPALQMTLWLATKTQL